MEKEDEEEDKIDYDDVKQFKVDVHKCPTNIEEICQNIKSSAGLLGLEFIKYDKLNKTDKLKIEEAMYEMMATFKTMPLEIGNIISKEIYNKIEEK